MKINIAGLEFRIRRTRVNDQQNSSISNDQLRILNNPTLDYIARLTEDELQRRIEQITVNSLNSEGDYQNAKSKLREYGIFIVPNFIKSSTLEKSRDKINQIVTLISEKSDLGNNFEDDSILIQIKDVVLKTYGDLAAFHKAVATVRLGQDQGMIDIFNIDKLLDEEKKELRRCYANEWLLKILSTGHEILKPANLNLYVNNGITQTRGFHVDDYANTLKGFVYLTDVKSLDDGPYCFVLGSHGDDPWRNANKQIGKACESPTESPFVDLQMIAPILAPKGSLVLSNQSGIHRGIPQMENAKRHVLVMRYR